MSNPQITIIGRVGKVYELAFGQTGTARINLSIATTKPIKDKNTGTWSDGPTSWWRITAWGQLAENIDATQLTPGDQVVVVGEISEREFTDKDGAARRVVDVNARHLAVDLDRATATVRRVTRTAPAAANETAPW